jgi:hypothetical protein
MESSGVFGPYRKGVFRENSGPFVKGKKSDMPDKLKLKLVVIMLVRETKVSDSDN